MKKIYKLPIEINISSGNLTVNYIHLFEHNKQENLDMLHTNIFCFRQSGLEMEL